MAGIIGRAPVVVKGLKPSPVLTRPITFGSPTLGLKFPPVSTVQNLGQEYEFQSYNADGKIVTRKSSLAQLLLGGEFRGVPGQNFSPQTFGNLSAQTQQSEAKIISSLNLTTAQAAKVLQDSVKIDYSLCVKSAQSQPVDLNLLQTPELSAKFVYNFYDAKETDIVSQEDQRLDPLLYNQKPPRYVFLAWDVVSTISGSDDFASRTRAEQQMVNRYINTVRGNATLSNQQVVNSFESRMATVEPLFRDGKALKFVDTHDQQTAFNSTSNSRLFKNTAVTTINTNNIDLNTINFTDLILDDLI